MYHKTTGYRVFSYFNYAFMILAGSGVFSSTASSVGTIAQQQSGH